MVYIQAYLTIEEIVEQYPETLDVFLSNGFEADGKDALYRRYGASTILNQALKNMSLNKETFMELLKAKVEAEIESGQRTLTERTPPGEIDFVGNSVCLLRNTFRESFDDWMTEYREKTGRMLNCYIPGSCGNGNAYSDIWKAGRIEDFPSAVTACGFGDFFRKEFVETLVNKGHFKTVERETIHPDFPPSVFLDPDGWYTLYGVYPYVLLIDRSKLGDLPEPKVWSDLLNPVYEKQIIVIGSSNKVSELLLMTIYKDHGEDGLRRLANNIKDGWHSSKMAKTAGSSNPEGAAIYYIPWAFAKSCPKPERVSILWPEDGAIVNPLFMLVKDSKLEEVKDITDFITGAELGQKAASSYFPVLNPEIDNGLPEGASFNWLGWDYIKSNDIQYLKEYTQSVFKKYWKKEN